FYSAQIREDHYLTPQTVTRSFQFPAGNHFGGDEALALEFLRVMDGQASRSDLTAGLASAAVCLAAKQADAQGRFVAVDY
ncbi:MAG: hypothetical protein UFE80_08315, partial [Christensenellales bacterium]|nr:hypothetical protein [Christensenellales bacterium]